MDIAHDRALHEQRGLAHYCRHSGRICRQDLRGEQRPPALHRRRRLERCARDPKQNRPIGLPNSSAKPPRQSSASVLSSLSRRSSILCYQDLPRRSPMLSPTVIAPATPTPPEEIAEAIDQHRRPARPAARRPPVARAPRPGSRRQSRRHSVRRRRSGRAHGAHPQGRDPRAPPARRPHGAVHRPHRPNDRRAALLAHERLRRPGIRRLAGVGAADSSLGFS